MACYRACMPQDGTPPAFTAKAMIDAGNKSFGEPTGDCMRCGATEDVALIRGANLCGSCFRSGVAPRYDVNAARARSSQAAQAARSKEQEKRAGAKLKVERKRAAKAKRIFEEARARG